MPSDSTETFAGMKEQQLKKILPAERVAEYLKDAQLVTTDEVAALGLHGKLLAVDQKGEVVYEDDNGELVKLEVDGSGKAGFVDKNGTVVEADRVRTREVTDGQGLDGRPV